MLLEVVSLGLAYTYRNFDVDKIENASEIASGRRIHWRVTSGLESQRTFTSLLLNNPFGRLKLIVSCS